MHNSIIRSFLALATIASALPSHVPAKTQLLFPRQLPADLNSSLVGPNGAFVPPGVNGSFTVTGCNDDYHRSVVQTLIGSTGITGDIAHLVFPELLRANQSTLFNLIFKDTTYLPEILGNFSRIYRHDTVSYGDLSRGSVPRYNSTINFLCIVQQGAEDGYRTEDYKWWLQHLNATNKVGDNTLLAVGSLGSSHYWTTEPAQVSPDIWIWPSFFDQDYIPSLPTSDYCPTGKDDGSSDSTTGGSTGSGNTAGANGGDDTLTTTATGGPSSTNTTGQVIPDISDGNKLIKTQYGALVQSLANKYLNEGYTRGNDTVQEVLDLTAEQAVANPASYAWFASALKADCDLSLISFLDDGDSNNGGNAAAQGP